MPQLGNIRAAAQAFTAHAAFNPGSRYEDFDPSLDRKAEYGIGGLVAAGVGVAVAKKLGLLAIDARTKGRMAEPFGRLHRFAQTKGVPK